jgi:hypothetical protein
MARSRRGTEDSEDRWASRLQQCNSPPALRWLPAQSRALSGTNMGILQNFKHRDESAVFGGGLFDVSPRRTCSALCGLPGRPVGQADCRALTSL